jgi:lysophospholipase L1-like esterase
VQKKHPIILSVLSLLFTFLLLEGVFRVILPAAYYPVMVYQEGVGLHYSPDQEGKMTFGPFARHPAVYRINNVGWNSPHDYLPEKAENTLRVAVMGDSYVEALQVDYDESFPIVAEELVSKNCASYEKVEVYAFGFSGSPLSQYLSVMRYVAATYQPDIFVINIIHNDFDESFRSLVAKSYFLQFEINDQGEIEELPPEPYDYSPVRVLARRSATVRYVYTNLNLPKLIQQIRRDDEPEAIIVSGVAFLPGASAQTEATRQLVYYVLTQYQLTAQNAPLLLMMDGPREEIYGEEAAFDISQYNALVDEAAAELGIDFIDLTPVFEADYQANHIPFNSSDEWHWNEYGHQVVGEALADWIIQQVCQ